MQKANAKFIAFMDPRFLEQAGLELRSAAKDDIELKRAGARSFIFEARGVRGLKKSFVFIEGIAPVHLISEKRITEKMLSESISKLISKKRPFKLEVINENLKIDDSAKTTEVKIGTALEQKGFVVDLKNPEDYVIVQRNGKQTILCVVDAGRFDWMANPYRNTSREGKVNRAAYKLDEAFGYFKIDKEKIKTSLDIGSAPGGWTLYLSHFSKVVSIDPALLDYNAFKGRAIVVASDGKEGLPKQFPFLNMISTGSIGRAKGFDILHIASRTEKVLPKLDRFRFDILTIDANLPITQLAGIANSLSKTLGRDAILIMTIKLFNRNPHNQMKKAKTLLKGFKAFKFKKLPHNRDEVTLIAKVR